MKNTVKTLFLAAVFTFAAGASALGGDTARVPFRVNVGAAVTARPQSGGEPVSIRLSANVTDTLLLPLAKGTSVRASSAARGHLNAPAFTASRGNVSLSLPAQSYRNAVVSLYSVNGKRVLSVKASADGAAKGVARRGLAAGAYVLTATGVNGASFSARLTHSGGKLSVSAAFAGEAAPSAPLGKEAAEPDAWNISVSAAEREDSVFSFTPVAGINQRYDITLRAAAGFQPDMLGLTPGATTAGVNLNWISTNSASTGGDKALVRVYGADGTLIETFAGKAASHSTASGSSSTKRHHKAAVTGLAPNTNYKYSVSNNGADWSYKYNYKTPPSGNVFTIAVIADPQITDGNQDSNTKPKADPSTVAQGWKETVEKIAATDATFIVSAGDQVDAASYTESQYVKFFAPDALRSLPFSPVIGNHDLHTQFFNHFNMPNSAAAPNTNPSSYDVYSGGGNYYYLYNNILFVAFNTGSYPNTLKDGQDYVAKYKKTMDAAKAAHAGAYDWLIVQHHKSTTSISSHACDLEIEHYVKGGLEKLITESGVDVVITGHDHIHVRSHLMKWDDAKGYSVKSADGKGAIYLTISTASGVKFYPAFFILDPAKNEYVDDYTEQYPVLADLTKGWKEFGKVRGEIGSFSGTINPDKIPLSMDFYVKGKNSYDFTPNYTANYTIFEVNGKTIKAKTYGTVDNTVVDEFTLTPKGVR